ncbi:MAG: glycosyltransferase family 2 protein [Nitrosomonadales bacterium]|nr:glycosyltransferase family 2 protein [Nitrosomonadales bacterium]
MLKSHNRSEGRPEDISIVMPVYNHEATLAEAIESALMQEMPYASVIYCFNDLSSDGSAAILADYAERYPDKIRVYTNPRNLGSGKASYLHHRPPIRGRYWCLLAGDDYWTTREKLAKQIGFLDSHPDYVGCSCDSILMNEMTGERGVIKPSRDEWNLLDLLLLKHKYAFYVHTTSLVWRNIYLDQGFFLPPAFQKKEALGDVVLMHAMLSRGGKVRNIPELMSCYRMTGRGIWTRRSAQEQADMNARLPEIINRFIPLKYKLLFYLQKCCNKSRILRQCIPGPINE